MPHTVFLGIDVACARQKRLPVCFAAVHGARLEPLPLPVELAQKIPRGPGNREIQRAEPFKELAERFASIVNCIAVTKGWKIKGVAIDAPAAPPLSGQRLSEQNLGKHGLAYFRTPDQEGWKKIIANCRAHLRRGGSLNHLPYANIIWMLYGFEIFRALRTGNLPEVIEVYPYAIVRSLLDECPHKTTEEGYNKQLAAVASSSGWDPIKLERVLKLAVSGSKHDRLDAFMSAWVASLPAQDRQAFGTESDPNDAIWVPQTRSETQC